MDQMTTIKITGMKIEIGQTTRTKKLHFSIKQIKIEIQYSKPPKQRRLGAKDSLLTKKNGQGVARAREHKAQGRSTIMSHPIETLGFRPPQFSEVPSFNLSSILFTLC